MAMLERDAIMTAIARLIARTDERKQEWRVYESSEDEYVTSTKLFTYYVRSRDDDGTPPYVFDIFRKVIDADGEVQQAIKVGDIVTTPSNASSTKARNDQIERLYTAAKSSAFGIVGLEGDLLNDLD